MIHLMRSEESLFVASTGTAKEKCSLPSPHPVNFYKLCLKDEMFSLAGLVMTKKQYNSQESMNRLITHTGEVQH